MNLLQKLQGVPILKYIFGYGKDRPPMLAGVPGIGDIEGADGFPSPISSFYSEYMTMPQDRKTLYNELSVMSSDDVISCFVGDTMIPLLDGTESPIRDLVGKEDLWVYSYDLVKGCIVPGKVKCAKKTGRNAPLLAITLDSGEVVKCTPEHKWLLRSGEYKEAKELKSGDRIMPLYRKRDQWGYEKFQDVRIHTGRAPWYYTHRSFAPASDLHLQENVVHHKNYRKEDNRPVNLQWMTRAEHATIHMDDGRASRGGKKAAEWQRSPEGRAFHSKHSKQMWTSPEYREKFLASRFGSEEAATEWGKEGWERIQAKKQEDPLWETRRIAAVIAGITEFNKDEEKVLAKGKKISETKQNKTPEQKALVSEHVSASRTPEVRAKIGEGSRKNWEDPVYREKVTKWKENGFPAETSDKLSKSTTRLWDDPAWRANMMESRRRGKEARLVANHKIAKIEEAPPEDVYDLEVEQYHNFAISAGVFVHNSAADIFSEESVQPSLTKGRVFWVESENKDIRAIVDKLLLSLRLDEEAFALARELAVFGDSFSGILQALREDGTEGAIAGLSPIPPESIWRHEDKFGRLLGFSRGDSPNDENMSTPWAYLHMRLQGRQRCSMYGTSMLAPARRIYRTLRLAEDAAVIGRLKRCPSRLGVGINGLQGLPFERRFGILNRIRKEMSKKQFVDPASSQMRQEVEPWTVDDTIYFDAETVTLIPVPAGDRPDNALDLEYFRKRLFMCLRIPPDFLGLSEAAGGLLAQSPLAYQSISFAKSIKRIQHALLVGITRLCQIHLAWSGLKPQDPENDFTICMEPVSYLEEMQRAMLTRLRAEVLLLLEQIGQSMDIDRAAWLDYVAPLSGFPKEMFAQIGKGTASGSDTNLQGSVALSDSQKDSLKKVLSAPVVQDILSELAYTSKQRSSRTVPEVELPGLQIISKGPIRVTRRIEEIAP